MNIDWTSFIQHLREAAKKRLAQSASWQRWSIAIEVAELIGGERAWGNTKGPT